MYWGTCINAWLHRVHGCTQRSGHLRAYRQCAGRTWRASSVSFPQNQGLPDLMAPGCVFASALHPYRTECAADAATEGVSVHAAVRAAEGATEGASRGGEGVAGCCVGNPYMAAALAIRVFSSHASSSSSPPPISPCHCTPARTNGLFGRHLPSAAISCHQPPSAAISRHQLYYLATWLDSMRTSTKQG